MNHILSKFKRSAQIRSSQSGSTNPLKRIITKRQQFTAANNCTPADAPLEALPSEIRRLILSALTLKDLFVFIRASPVYLQQYLLDPKYIRRQCLFQTLHLSTPDAVYTYLTGEDHFLTNRNRRQLDSVQKMIGAYIRDRLSDPSALFHLLNQMTNTQVDAMVRFHCKIVCPLIHRFAEWALRNLGLDVRGEWTRTTDWDALSSTETMRMVRAMYRFQLMCNLFGLGRYIGDRSRSYFVSGHNTIFQAFLSNFTAFELEEVRCIFGYVVSRYDKVFQSIAADLHPDNPRFNTQQRPPTPDGAFDFLARGTDSTYDRSEYQLGTASRGLDLLHAVLIKTPYNTNDHGQHEDLVVTIQPQIARGPFLDMMDGALDTERYHYYRSDNPTERDEKEKKREPMIFVGDVSTWHDQDGDKDPPPPLAWTLMWGGTYSNLYGSCIPESIARWGYIFWDAERLIRSGGKELLMRQWEEEWSDFDVREQFPL